MVFLILLLLFLASDPCEENRNMQFIPRKYSKTLVCNLMERDVRVRAIRFWHIRQIHLIVGEKKTISRYLSIHYCSGRDTARQTCAGVID